MQQSLSQDPVRFRMRLTLLLLLGAGAILGLPRLLSAQEAEPIVIDAAAPELVGGPWLNTPKHLPITLASRKGKITVVEFWTFG